MSEPKRRFLERASTHRTSSTTLIAADTVIEGTVRGKGAFVVAGTVHGDGGTEGALHLASTATWIGEVRARDAVIAGNIVGDLLVEDKLEIGFTAMIRGRVRARTIAIARGAVVDGELEVTSDTAVVRFVERRREP